MKSLKLFLYALVLWFSIGTVAAQLPYTWTAGTDPGWTASGGDGNADLQWRSGCNVVTTNCNTNASNATYNNNEYSIYTSPSINASCSNASTIAVTFTASGNAEFQYDFLFIEYSVNNGPWINPYGPFTGWTGNFGAGFTIPAIILSANSNIRFRFIFQSDGPYPFPWSANIYPGYKITDFDIACNVVLPITLLSFDGVFDEPAKSNDLTWVTESERNNDYFTIERAAHEADGTLVWHPVTTYPGAGNSVNTIEYSFRDYEYTRDAINYYRISQTDYDGKKEVFDDMLVAIDNRDKNKKVIVKTINLLGQEVKPDTPGVVIYIYGDNTSKRVYNP